MRTASLLVLPLLTASACADPVLAGRVVDNFGQPVPGAIARIDGSALQATADDDGRFELPYVLGAFTMVVEAEDHQPTARELTLSEEVEFPLGDVALTHVPPEGVWIASTGGYAPMTMQQNSVQKRRSGKTRWGWRHTCTTHPALQPVAVRADAFLAVVNRAEAKQPWALMRVRNGVVSRSGDGRGCSRVERDIVEVEAEEVGDRALLTAKLRPGTWCLSRFESNVWTGARPVDRMGCFHLLDPDEEPVPGSPDAQGSPPITVDGVALSTNTPHWLVSTALQVAPQNVTFHGEIEPEWTYRTARSRDQGATAPTVSISDLSADALVGGAKYPPSRLDTYEADVAATLEAWGAPAETEEAPFEDDSGCTRTSRGWQRDGWSMALTTRSCPATNESAYAHMDWEVGKQDEATAPEVAEVAEGKIGGAR